MAVRLRQAEAVMRELLANLASVERQDGEESP
jgi:hypothetical protein